MSLPIIKSHPTEKRIIPTGTDYLNVSEFFADTIQGENFVGYPATFLRLQECTLDCRWCDTSEVWRYGNPYSFDELFELIDSVELSDRLKAGQHLVLTGGSPLKQQRALISFIEAFIVRYGFKPYIEIENECTLIPDQRIVNLVDLWNNSPKLKNAGNPINKQYRPPVLRRLSALPNAWFKFVVSAQSDWDEIEQYFLKPGHIRKDQIVLMPMGASRAELKINRPIAVEMAIRYNVRYTSREHIVLWDLKTGV